MYKAEWLDIILYLGCIQGFFLTALLWKKRPANRPAVQYLSWLAGLVSLLMLARVGYQVSWVQQLAEVLMVPDAILYLSGPLLWFFTRSVLHLPLPKGTLYWLHFLPAVLHVFLVNTVVGLTLGKYWQVLTIPQIILTMRLIEGTAIFSLSAYLYLCYRDYKNYQSGFYEKYAVPVAGTFLYWFFIAVGLLLLVWSGAFLDNLFSNPPTYLIYSVVWILITFAIYYLAYMVLAYPAILELPVLPAEAVEAAPVLAEIDPAGKTTLANFMETEKPFLDPEIKLDDLAGQLNWQRHELSKTINQGFGKNFFDFINEYRVREFIHLKGKPTHRHLGTLELAYAVGFNSKSAFNRAFKKETGQSPRVYFGQPATSGNFSHTTDI